MRGLNNNLAGDQITETGPHDFPRAETVLREGIELAQRGREPSRTKGWN